MTLDYRAFLDRATDLTMRFDAQVLGHLHAQQLFLEDVVRHDRVGAPGRTRDSPRGLWWDIADALTRRDAAGPLVFAPSMLATSRLELERSLDAQHAADLREVQRMQHAWKVRMFDTVPEHSARGGRRFALPEQPFVADASVDKWTLLHFQGRFMLRSDPPCRRLLHHVFLHDGLMRRVRGVPDSEMQRVYGLQREILALHVLIRGMPQHGR